MVSFHPHQKFQVPKMEESERTWNKTILGGWVFPYISRIHTASIGFRIPPFGWYRTKCLVIFEGSDSSQLTTYWSWAYPPSLWYGKSRQKTLVQCWRIQPPCFDTIVHHFRWNYSDLRGIPRKFHGKSWLVKYDNLARWITYFYCFGRGPRLEICLQKVSSQKQAYLYTFWGRLPKSWERTVGKGQFYLKGPLLTFMDSTVNQCLGKTQKQNF